MRRLALTASLLALPLSGWADTRRFALIAGANDGGADRVQLQYAVTDARAFASVLSELGGVPSANQTLLVEPDAAVFREAIENLSTTVATAEDRGLRTEVVVYYSGHSDETGLLLGEQAYPYDALRADLKQIGADVQVVVLDSCASGAMVRTKGGVHRPAFLEDQSNDVEGVAYLMSASADESAQESDVVGASYFTHFLVSGLRGGADQTGDGRVTLDEAYAFASQETLRRTERTSVGAQHAIFDMNMKGHGGFVFTDLTQTTSSLVFDEAVAGRLFVRDIDGRLVAELTKGHDRAVSIALEDGSYTVVLEQGEARYEGDFHIREAEHLLVTELELSAFEGEQVARKGGALAAADLPRSHLPFQTGGIAHTESVGLQVGFIGARAAHVSVQAGILYADADRVHGAQMSALVTHADEVHGTQLSPLGNVTSGEMEGFQASVLNVATGPAKGMQLGVVNSAKEVDGVQTGLVNHSTRTRGLQLGLINAGGEGSGLQIGLVNVAREFEGGAVGLLNLHPQGYNHLFLNTGTKNTLLLTGSWGGKYLFSQVQFGTRGLFTGPSVTGGIGGHVPVREGIFVDTDLTFGGRFSKTTGNGGIARWRVQPGWEINDHLAVLTGLTTEIDGSIAGSFSDRLRLGWTFGARL